MIWPLKKKTVDLPELTEVIFVDISGTRWKYKPVKHITALEVAKLLPVFASVNGPLNIWPYIKEHKLERHFAQVE
jgi:hypothetical protein